MTDYQTPRERFIQVIKWYLSAFHAGRKSTVPKKPYNPILGETFQCYYDIGASSSNVSLVIQDCIIYFLLSIDKFSKRWPCSVDVG